MKVLTSLSPFQVAHLGGVIWPTLVGDSTTADHIGCGEKKVTVTKTKIGHVWYCHKCQETGWTRERVYYGAKMGGPEASHSNIVKVMEPLVPLSLAATQYLHTLPLGQKMIETWETSPLAPAPFTRDVQLGEVASRPGDLCVRMSTLMHNPDGRLYWDQIRNTSGHGHHPKWMTTKHFSGPKYPCILHYGEESHPPQGPVLLLTEDILSTLALKLAGMTSAPIHWSFGPGEQHAGLAFGSMNGLILSFPALVQMSTHYRGVVFVVDNDEAGRKYLPELMAAAAKFWPVDRVQGLAFGKPSPKDVPMQDINDMFDFLYKLGVFHWT